MNKQEALKKIEKLEGLTIKDKDFNFDIEMIPKGEALEIVNQLDEPEKPVVPQFVAEWIKSQKESFSDASAIDMYDNLTLDNNGGYYHEVWLWVIYHHYDFIKAWHDGYTVEKEKLYTAKLKLTDEYLFYDRYYIEIAHNKVSNDVAHEVESYHFTEDDLVKYHIWENDAYEIKEVEE